MRGVLLTTLDELHELDVEVNRKGTKPIKVGKTLLGKLLADHRQLYTIALQAGTKFKEPS